jgi:hypothetical protein
MAGSPCPFAIAFAGITRQHFHQFLTAGLIRVVAERLAQRLDQSVIVENKPGANGMIAASAVAGADPDGTPSFRP